MKIHYISVHETLEHDEVRLLTEMGHQVFSNGAYLNPYGHPGLKRPGIMGAWYSPDLERVARRYPRTELPNELIEPFDLIIIMHSPNIVDTNWKRIRHKKVIWRSIGQSTPSVERMLKPLRDDGLKVMRYSPMEEQIPHYIGSDGLVRFYKDPSEFKHWNGNTKQVINLTQSLKARRDHCHYDEIMELIDKFNGKVYGSGNEDLGTRNGGELPYEQFKQVMRDARVFIYGGTWPAPYTLSFIEAMMTGTPIVAIGKAKAENPPGVNQQLRFNFYEVSEIIENGKTGYVSDNIDELKENINKLLESHEHAQQISANARRKAIDLFGKPNIKQQWNEFLSAIM